MMRNGQAGDDLLSRARWQVEAVEALSQLLAAEKEGLRRLYWAAQLDAVRDQVRREVEFEQTRECIAGSAFNKSKMEDSLKGFGVGVVRAWTRQINDDPLLAGLRHADHYLRQTAPFGTIMVLVGSRGVFGDVRALSISRIAREQRQPESDVITAIKAKGGNLMTPEAYFQKIEDLRQKVSDGSITIRLPQP